MKLSYYPAKVSSSSFTRYMIIQGSEETRLFMERKESEQAGRYSLVYLDHQGYFNHVVDSYADTVEELEEKWVISYLSRPFHVVEHRKGVKLINV
jgi:hypothetical protein